MRKVFSFLLLLIVVLSCTKVVNRDKLVLTKGKVYSVVPFENYTDTPLAGFRVASILEGVLRSEGYRVIRVWDYTYTEPDRKELERWRREAMKKADFVIFGTVNEFRYKAGVEGEPAVSLSVFLYDAKKGEVVGGASGSASGWSYESLGTLTQKLIRKLLLK
ncbi:MAG: hypothetical protein GXN96_04505 [Aquificae bacterium]|nr:hypothetical protein [Aquificota bacterium]